MLHTIYAFIDEYKSTQFKDFLFRLLEKECYINISVGSQNDH